MYCLAETPSQSSGGPELPVDEGVEADVRPPTEATLAHWAVVLLQQPIHLTWDGEEKTLRWCSLLSLHNIYIAWMETSSRENVFLLTDTNVVQSEERVHVVDICHELAVTKCEISHVSARLSSCQHLEQSWSGTSLTSQSVTKSASSSLSLVSLPTPSCWHFWPQLTQEKVAS